MIELYEAVKNLLAQKETYFDRHPEAVPIAESISEQDPEYDAAWDRLENAFNHYSNLQQTVELLEPEYRGTEITSGGIGGVDKTWKPVGGIDSHS